MKTVLNFMCNPKLVHILVSFLVESGPCPGRLNHASVCTCAEFRILSAAHVQWLFILNTILMVHKGPFLLSRIALTISFLYHLKLLMLQSFKNGLAAVRGLTFSSQYNP